MKQGKGIWRQGKQRVGLVCCRRCVLHEGGDSGDKRPWLLLAALPCLLLLERGRAMDILGYIFL